MNIDDFHYILAIAEEGGVTKAAKKVFITQPALSQRVKWIENRYQIQIFTRGMDGTHLTRDGECFVKYAQEIINSERNLVRELSDLHDLKTGVLRIGLSQLANSFFLHDLIVSFHEDYPDVKFEFDSGASYQLLPKLLSGKLDLGLFFVDEQTKGVKREFLFDDRLVVIPHMNSHLSEKVYRKEDGRLYIRPEDLSDEPLALPNVGTKVYSLLEEAFEKAGIEPNVQQWSRSYNVLVTIADMGLASAVVLESFLSEDRMKGDCYYIDCDTQLSLAKYVLWPDDYYLTSLAERFIESAKGSWERIQHSISESER